MLFLGVASYWTLGHVPFMGDSQLPTTLPTYGYIPRLPKRKHKRAYANWRNRVEFAAIQSTTVICYLRDFFRFSTQIKGCLFLCNAVYMHFALFYLCDLSYFPVVLCPASRQIAATPWSGCYLKQLRGHGWRWRRTLYEKLWLSENFRRTSERRVVFQMTACMQHPNTMNM